MHGLSPAQALSRLQQGLHEARVLGAGDLLVITGLGWGNPGQEPILRSRVEAWLKGPEGRRAGVRSFQRVSRGGALELRLGRIRAEP